MVESVKNTGKKLIFPKTIPEKRKNRDVIAKVSLAVVFIGVGVFCAESRISFLITSLCYTFLLFIIPQLCIRTCNLFEEYYHLTSRYENNIYSLLRKTFEFDHNKTPIIIALCGAFLMGNPLQRVESDGLIAWALVFIGMNILVTIWKLEESHLNTAKLIDELKGLDYGSGMAHSFFHGYLNLILPCTGDARRGLKEQIGDYESTHNVKFPSKKLYIFIPSSAYCPTTITNLSNIMEPANSLDWQRLDRAGVRSRQYHNSVYKVIPNENSSPIYVCAEYATPLLTLHEVINHNSDDSRRYKEYQTEIVTNFYLTLHKIIAGNRDCRGLAELIYFKDVDNDGNPLDLKQLDVGVLLLEKIKQDICSGNI